MTPMPKLTRKNTSAQTTATKVRAASADGLRHGHQHHAGDRHAARIEDPVGERAHAAVQAIGHGAVVGVVDRLEDRVGERLGVDLGGDRERQARADREAAEAGERGRGEHEVAHERRRALDQRPAGDVEQDELEDLDRGEDHGEEGRHHGLVRELPRVDGEIQIFRRAIDHREHQRVEREQQDQRVAPDQRWQQPRGREQAAASSCASSPRSAAAGARRARAAPPPAARAAAARAAGLRAARSARAAPASSAAHDAARGEREVQRGGRAPQLEAREIGRGGHPEHDVGDDVVDMGADQHDEVDARRIEREQRAHHQRQREDGQHRQPEQPHRPAPGRRPARSRTTAGSRSRRGPRRTAASAPAPRAPGTASCRACRAATLATEKAAASRTKWPSRRARRRAAEARDPGRDQPRQGQRGGRRRQGAHALDASASGMGRATANSPTTWRRR